MDGNTDSMELTAKEILKKNYLESIKGMESINTPHFPLAFEDAALAAMKEVVELAWQAGKDATITNAHKYSDTYVISSKIEDDKTEFINSLFPESKSPGIEFDYGIVDEFTKGSGSGLVVSNDITSTE